MSELSLEEIRDLDAGNVMQTYGRAPVAFVRGEGTVLYDSAGTLPMSADTNRCAPSSKFSSQSTPATSCGMVQSVPLRIKSRRTPAAARNSARCCSTLSLRWYTASANRLSFSGADVRRGRRPCMLLLVGGESDAGGPAEYENYSTPSDALRMRRPTIQPVFTRRITFSSVRGATRQFPVLEGRGYA